MTDYTDETLGERMKRYEADFTDAEVDIYIPVFARMDGQAFHTFTKGMQRPFDGAMTDAMIATTVDLVEHTGADVGYCQSDEITLAWNIDAAGGSQMWFGGKLFKLLSSLASRTTLAFYKNINDGTDDYYYNADPTFDARVWNVPNLKEATNVFLWRELDATKNSATMLASSYFSHKQLLNKSTQQRKEMLLTKGVDWETLAPKFQRGTYVTRKSVRRKLSLSEISSLPEKHEARMNPDMEVVRWVCGPAEMPPLTSILNRTDVLFHGADPITTQTLV